MTRQDIAAGVNTPSCTSLPVPAKRSRSPAFHRAPVAGVVIVAIGRTPAGDDEWGRYRRVARVAGHLQPDRVRAARIDPLRADLGRIIEHAVAVEVPGIQQRPARGIDRPRAVELHRERIVAAGRGGGGLRGQRTVGDSPDRAADRRIIDIAAGPDLQRHRHLGGALDDVDLARIRDTTGIDAHGVDAVHRVVSEEQRLLVPARVAARSVE